MISTILALVLSAALLPLMVRRTRQRVFGELLTDSRGQAGNSGLDPDATADDQRELLADFVQNEATDAEVLALVQYAIAQRGGAAPDDAANADADPDAGDGDGDALHVRVGNDEYAVRLTSKRRAHALRNGFNMLSYARSVARQWGTDPKKAAVEGIKLIRKGDQVAFPMRSK
jgi:hypothetical protein